MSNGAVIRVASREGRLFRLGAGDRCEVLGTFDLGEPVLATPAIAFDALFVRTAGHLLRLGRPAPAERRAELRDDVGHLEAEPEEGARRSAPLAGGGSQAQHRRGDVGDLWIAAFDNRSRCGTLSGRHRRGIDSAGRLEPHHPAAYTARVPSIDDNRRNWDDPKAWQRAGEEWSEAWGSTASMWHGSILPRIAPFLPAAHLLEIACGHGRVTEYLLAHCSRYSGVDLAPSCVGICRTRFAGRRGAEFRVADGRSLPMVGDDSIDFAFSWDSLVHADRVAVGGYVSELARVLREGGTAFLHHSNLAAFADETGSISIDNPHWRDITVSAAAIREMAEAAGLECRSQELVQWGCPDYSDCFSVLRQPVAGEARRAPITFSHPDMGAEMSHFRDLDRVYRTP